MASLPGRAAASSALREAAALARRAQPQVGLVLGASGMGKSTLVNAALAEPDAAAAWRTIRIDFDPDDRNSPFDAVDRLLDQLLATAAERVGPEPIALAARLFTALESLQAPVRLVIDDAHWLDALRGSWRADAALVEQLASELLVLDREERTALLCIPLAIELTRGELARVLGALGLAEPSAEALLAKEIALWLAWPCLAVIAGIQTVAMLFRLLRRHRGYTV